MKRGNAKDYLPAVWLLAMLSALGPMATSIYQPSIPAVAQGLATTTGAVQSTLPVYLATIAIASLFVGPICGYLGRKPVLVTGLTIYTLASAAMASISIDMLIAARIFQAIGACAAGAVGGAVVRDVFDPRQLVRVMALYSMFVSMMPGVSPGVGGSLQDAFNRRAPFAFISLLGPVLLSWALLGYRETFIERVVMPASGGLAMQQVAPREAATAGALSGSLHMLFGAAGAMWVSLTTAQPAAGFPLVMAIMGVVGLVLWLAIRRSSPGYTNRD